MLLELTMPQLDGSETFAGLARLAPDVPVILTSGFSEQEAVARFVGHGLAGLLQKPPPPQTLLTTIEQVLGHEQAESVEHGEA